MEIKVESNAIKIAELLGYELVPSLLGTGVYYHLGDRFTQNEVNRLFSSYQGLMPIVFECNRTDEYGITINWSVRLIDKTNGKTLLYFFKVGLNTESEFIEAIQEACIKYLELKNGNSLGS